MIDKDVSQKGEKLKQQLTDMAYEDYQNEQQLASQAISAMYKDAVKSDIDLNKLTNQARENDETVFQALPFFNKSIEDQSKFLEENLKVSQEQADQTRELLEYLKNNGGFNPNQNPVLPPPELTNTNTYNYNFNVEGGISTFRKGVLSGKFNSKIGIEY